MANIREILAQNLKENRRRLGFTQHMLAERASMSTHYLGMIEIGRNFPTADMLERLAEALEINSNELFIAAATPERVIEDLQQAVLKTVDQRISESMERATQNLDQVVTDAVSKALAEQLKEMRSASFGYMAADSGKK